MSSAVSLANGRTYLAIPGPSVMPERVLRAMQRPAPDIYNGAAVDLNLSLVPDLKRIAGTTAHLAMYIGNGHAGWEAVISNAFSRGDLALSLITGNFGLGWANHARAMGVEVETIDFGLAAPVDLTRVAAALEADQRRGNKIMAVLITHVDTATGVRNDVPGLRRLLDDLGHPALLMVDCVASMGCDEFHMDAWGADLAVAASQKGLMTPPGLAFVWFSEKARERSLTADLRTPYWDWHLRAKGGRFAEYWGGTPPVHHLYALREALDMIAEEGLANVWARHEALASALWAAGEAWAKEGDFRLNIADPDQRGRSVTAMRLAAPDGERLRQFCSEQAGVTLGVGLGMAPFGSFEAGAFFRVGHMGHVNAHQLLGVIAVMETGMQALGIAHGAGGASAAIARLAGHFA